MMLLKIVKLNNKKIQIAKLRETPYTSWTAVHIGSTLWSPRILEKYTPEPMAGNLKLPTEAYA